MVLSGCFSAQWEQMQGAAERSRSRRAKRSRRAGALTEVHQPPWHVPNGRRMREGNTLPRERPQQRCFPASNKRKITFDLGED